MKKLVKLLFWLLTLTALAVAYLRKVEPAVCFFENLFERTKFALVEILKSEQGIE